MSFYCLGYGCGCYVNVDDLLKETIVCAVEEDV